MSARKPYPSDVSDDERALVAPYLTLLPEVARQHEHSLREAFNGLRYVIKTGAPRRWMPNDLPPWAAVCQQVQHWLAAGCFEALAEDLRTVLRLAAGRKAQPALPSWTAARYAPRRKAASRRAMMEPSARMVPSCTWRSARWAICWLSNVTPASTDDRAEVGRLARAVQASTGQSVELEVVKLPEARRGFVLLPRRWVVEGSFAWASRFRRLVKDYERYATTLADLHLVAFACIILKQAAQLAAGPWQPLEYHRVFTTYACVLDNLNNPKKGFYG